MTDATNTQTLPLTYKNHPLMRKGEIIYYGSMADKYIIMMQVLSNEKVEGFDVSQKVSINLQLTDPDISSVDRVVKSTEKQGLFNAMDIASIWLERALSGK